MRSYAAASPPAESTALASWTPYRFSTAVRSARAGARLFPTKVKNWTTVRSTFASAGPDSVTRSPPAIPWWAMMGMRSPGGRAASSRTSIAPGLSLVTKTMAWAPAARKAS